MKSSFLAMSVLALGLMFQGTFAKTGPVSAYGQLQTGQNTYGQGRIYGSCPAYNTTEVQVQGMSLFWSISADVGAPFWTADYVTGLVERQNIQLIRAAMGVDEDWGAGNYFTNESYYKGLMNTVVQSAIDNDIYVIIDYHSHYASSNVSNAKTFFTYMAEKWGGYDNVIFEIFNEPKEQSWSEIKTYADEVVATIRKYSDNLILVGSRSWDQYPNEALSSPVTDSKGNTAYTFHFYAGSHSISNEGANAVAAMNGGLSVFVSEYGTVDASGDGGFNASNSLTWLNWMNQYKLSGANWAVSNKGESASYFSGSAWNYSESGQWVNANVFANLPKSYTACSGAASSSSSVVSSSSSSMPEGTTDYIDDFEDGDSLAYTGGIWYAYTDVESGASSTIANATNAEGYNVIYKGSSTGNSSNYVAGLSGISLNQGSYKYDPFVALGLKLNADESAYDLSNCSTISYKYKGAAHNFKAEDLNVSDYGYHQISKFSASSWTTVTLTWDMLNQESWAKSVTLSKKNIAKFTWEVKGSTPAYNYLYIDDVRCNGMTITPVVVTSSSSSVKSSSSVYSSSSKNQSSSSVSSSSVKSSSSVNSSSSVTDGVIIVGNLNQTVIPGGTLETVTISGITSYTRSWGINFIDIPQNATNGSVTIGGTVQTWAPVGDYTETLTINGFTYTLNVKVVASESELSSSSVQSSSSYLEESSSSETTGIALHQDKSLFIAVQGKMLSIVGSSFMNVDVFDLQGRPLKSFYNVQGALSLESLQAGSYIVRVRSGSRSLSKRISIK